MPEYYICRGSGDHAGHNQHIYCQSDVALKCLEDLRGNYSKNVSPKCSYEAKRVVCEATENFQSQKPRYLDQSANQCHVLKSRKSGMELLAPQSKVRSNLGPDHDRSKNEWADCCPNVAAASVSSSLLFDATASSPDAVKTVR